MGTLPCGHNKSHLYHVPVRVYLVVRDFFGKGSATVVTDNLVATQRFLRISALVLLVPKLFDFVQHVLSGGACVSKCLCIVWHVMAYNI
jgi:hypothetical protein